MIRAEALFRRFQRTVEAIDKKNNFPEPRVRQRKPVSSPEEADKAPTGASSSGAEPQRPKSAGKAKQSTSATDEQLKNRVISPELRSLLSRKVEKLEKKDIVEHGGGIGS